MFKWETVNKICNDDKCTGRNVAGNKIRLAFEIKLNQPEMCNYWEQSATFGLLF